MQAQIESIEHRATKIKNAFFYTLAGTSGIMMTCLLLGLALYAPQALVVAVLFFVLSVLSILVGTLFYVSEVAISLSSEKEEEQLYDLMDVMSAPLEEKR